MATKKKTPKKRVSKVIKKPKYAVEARVKSKGNKKLQEHVALLCEILEWAKRPHFYVAEDCWLSCPLSLDKNGESNCCNKEAVDKGVCTCGVTAFNHKIDLVLQVTQPTQP